MNRAGLLIGLAILVVCPERSGAGEPLTPDRVRGQVLNERIDEAWIDGHRLIYRRATDGGSEWRLVDARVGDSRPAFDHSVLATRLSEVRGGPVAAESLPVVQIRPDGEGWIIGTRDPVVWYRFDPDAGTLREAARSEWPSSIERTRTRRSRDRGGRVEVVFVNPGGETVEVYWIDREGEPRFYAAVPPGGSHTQGTFAGHLWSVRVGGRELGRYEAPRSGGVVVVPDVVEEPAEASSERRSEESPDRYRSPDGRYRAISQDDGFRVIRSGVAEPVIDVEGSVDDAFTSRIVWSSDSRHVLVVRTIPEERREVTWVESSPRDQVQPKVHRRQYLKPGDRIAHPRPIVFDVERGERVPVSDALFPNPWSIGALEYWDETGEFTFLYNERGHQVYRWMAIDPSRGTVRAIVEEKSATFVDYPNKTFARRLPDGVTALWMSERSGWNHLYRVDVRDGSIAPVTRGEWLVRAVDEVDVDAGFVRFRAMGVYPEQDPYHVHHGRVNLDGSGLVWLTSGDGTHDDLRYAPTGEGGASEYYLARYSRVDLPPVHEVRRVADGSLVLEVERADDRRLRATGWRPPERFAAVGRDGTTMIWGHLILPSDFDPTERYPVLESIYAGPHDHHVPKAFAAWHAAREWAELGLVVVQIDGMGTNWRRKAFHDVCWQNLGDSGFPDRMAWMRAAASTRPYLDLARVGIIGGSAGGQSALRALLAHGEFYGVAVADCGCHDNRMDKIWWNELWMGWPIGPHYAEQSNVTHAHRLEGALMLVVGELDHNVDPSSTMQVVMALVDADKDFDLLYLPGVGHGAAGTPYARRRIRAFFQEHLIGPGASR